MEDVDLTGGGEYEGIALVERVDTAVDLHRPVATGGFQGHRRRTGDAKRPMRPHSIWELVQSRVECMTANAETGAHDRDMTAHFECIYRGADRVFLPLRWIWNRRGLYSTVSTCLKPEREHEHASTQFTTHHAEICMTWLQRSGGVGPDSMPPAMIDIPFLKYERKSSDSWPWVSRC